HHARARVPRQAQAARPAGLVPGRRTTMSDEGSGDLLARATRALRAESSAPEAAAEGPWQIMDGWSAVARSMRRAGRRRRLLLLGGLQVGLALAGLGAWAAVSGHLPALFSAPAPASEPGAAPRRRAHREAVARLAAEPTGQAAPPLAPAPPDLPAPVAVDQPQARLPAPGRPSRPALAS